MQSVQRQVKTLIEGKDAYNLQEKQDWNYNAVWSSSKIDQDESSPVLTLYVVCWTRESRSI